MQKNFGIEGDIRMRFAIMHITCENFHAERNMKSNHLAEGSARGNIRRVFSSSTSATRATGMPAFALQISSNAKRTFEGSFRWGVSLVGLMGARAGASDSSSSL